MIALISPPFIARVGGVTRAVPRVARVGAAKWANHAGRGRTRQRARGSGDPVASIGRMWRHITTP